MGSFINGRRQRRREGFARVRGGTVAIAFQIVSPGPSCVYVCMCARAQRDRPAAGVKRNTFLPRRFVAAATVLHPFICVYALVTGGGGRVDPCRRDRSTGARRSLSDGLFLSPPTTPVVAVATVFSFVIRRYGVDGWLGGWVLGRCPHRFSPPPGARYEKNGARPANRSRARYA